MASNLPDLPSPVDRRLVPLPLDKQRWCPSPLPGQIVLVTTVSDQQEIDVAPKSWVSMAAFTGPVVGFGCSTSHRTQQNIAATGEFVVNIVPAALAAIAWSVAATPAAERVRRSGLSFAAATSVAPPIVLDCPAHLECRHLRTVSFDGGEVFIFGTVVAATIDERCRHAGVAPDYRLIDPCFFLEDGLYAGLGQPRPGAGS